MSRVIECNLAASPSAADAIITLLNKVFPATYWIPPDHQYFQIFDGDTLIAVASMSPEGWFCNFAVAPDRQGQGLGRELFGYVARCYPRFRWISTPAAVGFYERMGYSRPPESVGYYSHKPQ
jgi:GNAT superfamily N-acetyltransferase